LAEAELEGLADHRRRGERGWAIDFQFDSAVVY
jgi:hypothetical protein